MKPPVEREDAVTQSKTTKRTHLKEEKQPVMKMQYFSVQRLKPGGKFSNNRLRVEMSQVVNTRVNLQTRTIRFSSRTGAEVCAGLPLKPLDTQTEV